MSDKNFTVDGTFRNSENSKSSAESSFDRRDSYLTVISLGILAAFLSRRYLGRDLGYGKPNVAIFNSSNLYSVLYYVFNYVFNIQLVFNIQHDI